MSKLAKLHSQLTSTVLMLSPTYLWWISHLYQVIQAAVVQSFQMQQPQTGWAKFKNRKGAARPWLTSGPGWLLWCLSGKESTCQCRFWGDPACHGATRPMHHSYWAHAVDLRDHNDWAHVPQLLSPHILKPMFRNQRSQCSEKPAHHSWSMASACCN